MTSDDARELFSEAFEGELDEAKQATFDALLDEQVELRAEYDDFVETLTMVGAIQDQEPLPDLLPQIQAQLRRRSRGRYYRDRFSQRAGRFSWALMVLAIITVVGIVGAAVYAMQTQVMDVSFEPVEVPVPSG